MSVLLIVLLFFIISAMVGAVTYPLAHHKGFKEGYRAARQEGVNR